MRIRRLRTRRAPGGAFRNDVPSRAGFGLIELVVALTIFSIGVLSLAAAAAVAQRAFGSAEAIERGANAAAAVIDSLMHEPLPVDGEHVQPGTTTRWTVEWDSLFLNLLVRVEVADGGPARTFEFLARRPRG